MLHIQFLDEDIVSSASARACGHSQGTTVDECGGAAVMRGSGFRVLSPQH